MLAESTDIKSRAFAEIYQEHGDAVLQRAMAHHRAHEGISRLEKFRHCHREFLGIALTGDDLDRLGRRYSAMVEDAVVACDWVPGARDFLEAHHRRLGLFVISGTPEDEIRRIVERRGMARYFRAVRGSPSLKAPIIESLLAGHGYRPEGVLFVGDAMTDFDAARTAGIRFIGRVAPGRASPFPDGTETIADLTALLAIMPTRQ